jgi:hypothetical protein
VFAGLEVFDIYQSISVHLFVISNRLMTQNARWNHKDNFECFDFIYKIKTLILYAIIFFAQNRTTYESRQIWYSQTDRPQMTEDPKIRRIRVSCWITNERIKTHTHDIQYLLLSLERPSMLHLFLHYLSCFMA